MREKIGYFLEGLLFAFMAIGWSISLAGIRMTNDKDQDELCNYKLLDCSNGMTLIAPEDSRYEVGEFIELREYLPDKKGEDSMYYVRYIIKEKYKK